MSFDLLEVPWGCTEIAKVCFASLKVRGTNHNVAAPDDLEDSYT